MPMLTYAAEELPVRITSDTCDIYFLRSDSSASLSRNKSTVPVPVWRVCFVRLRIATRQAGRRPSRLLMRGTTPFRILEPPKPVRQSIFNSTLSFEIFKNLYTGANGYYLKQLTGARSNGVSLPA
jgi:hypothetical protein